MIARILSPAWSEALGQPINVQPRYFPVSGDDAARLIVAVDMLDGTEAALALTGAVLRGVWVDAAGRRALAQGGCTLGDVDRETQLHGLAAVLGFVSATGIAGLTVGLATQAMKPVAEAQFDGFMYPMVDHIICHAARLRYRTRGRMSCPMVLRAPAGGGIRAVEHHSESPEAMFAGAVKIKTDLALKDGKTAEVAAAIGQSIMGPGNFVKDPISAISFGMALMFGTAGLPHILMRFFTVPNAKEARKSVFWATTWIGYFYVLIFIIGFGAITLVLTNPEFADVAKGVIKGGAGTANMAAVLVAKSVGGDVFYGFISAVAFATILAVVAGLTLSGAAQVWVARTGSETIVLAIGLPAGTRASSAKGSPTRLGSMCGGRRLRRLPSCAAAIAGDS
mgnify:CR=1 FL=1